MANEVAIVRENWPDIAGRLKDMPVPFRQDIFLVECQVAGTLHIDDVVVKAREVLRGNVAELVLIREPGNEDDAMAIRVETPDGNKIGYVPKDNNTILAHLMDAGKRLVPRVVHARIEDHWLNIRIAIDMKET